MATIQQISQSIEDYKKRFYQNDLLRGGIFFSSYAITAYLSLVVLEYYGHFSSGTRTFLFLSLLGSYATLFAYWMGFPIYKIVTANQHLSDEQAAAQIGAFFPEIKDKLLNTLQLSSMSAAQGSLIAATIDQRTQALGEFQFTQAVDLNENKKHLKRYLLLPFIILVGVGIGYRSLLADGTDRLVHFDEEFAVPAPFTFELEDSHSVIYAEDYTIKVKTIGSEVPEQMNIVIDGQEVPIKKNGPGSFEYTFQRVSEDQQFHFTSGQYNSKSVSLDVLFNPSILKKEAILQFPAYTRKEAITVENTNDYAVPAGTKITWNITTDQTDKLLIDNNLVQKSNSIFKFDRRFIKSSSIEMKAENSADQTHTKQALNVAVIPDEYPQIRINSSQDTTFYQHVLLAGRLADDYGFSSLKLRYEILDEDGQKLRDGSQSIPFNSLQEHQNFFHHLNMQEMNIQPGEQLTFHVEAWDNDAINGPKKTSTQSFKFRIPTANELENKTDEAFEETNDNLEEHLEETKDLRDELHILQDDLKTKKNLNWEDKKELNKVLDKQNNLQEQLEQLQEELQQDNEQFEQFNKENKTLEEKAKKLEDLMENIMDEEYKKLMEELQKMMNENIDPKDLLEKLDKLDLKSENMENELDKSIEMLKKLQMDRKMEQLKDKLEELAKEQEQLAEETLDKQNDAEELQKEQDKLNEQFEEVKKDMEELNELNESMENQKELGDFNEESESIDKKMEDASESLEKNKRKDASESQENAAEEMKKMKEMLASMQQKAQMEENKENMDDLRQLLENLVKASYDQERIMKDFRKVRQRDPRFVTLSQEQLELQNSTQIIKDSLLALAKRVEQIEPHITRELTDMYHNMELSADAIKARRARLASGRQQYSMTAMNNLALMLSEVLKQMQQQMADQMAGDQMCNKPGGTTPNNMGDMQKGLSEMLQKLKNGDYSGRELSQKLAEMAARQQMIREALKQMGENGEGLPSDELKELQKLMKETEQDLLNNNVTQRTIERQKEIETRLLESEKSERERDMDNKRKSETGIEKERINPPSLDEFLKLKEQQIELLKTIPPNLTPYYKKEVNQYFQTIEK